MAEDRSITEDKNLTLAQRMGWSKPPTEASGQVDIKKREDRIGQYFTKYMDRFVFAELSDAYLDRTQMTHLMKGVPVPLRKEDLEDFRGGEGIRPEVLLENIAWVMGCDPHFKYTEKYVEFIHTYFNHKVYEGMLKRGRDKAEQEEYDEACIHFRASLCVHPQYMDAMYSYARVCRAMYMEASDREYVGRFKAEALDWFEILTQRYPKFSHGHYYLGYAYLNIGLYKKAEIAWENYLKHALNSKDRREIKNRLRQIADPVRIEEGCNDISTGHFDRGLEILEPYLSTQFNDWWPLHYYIGTGYAHTGRTEEAVEQFREALSRNPSHLDTMEELLAIYESRGDKENIQKYQNKIKMVRDGLDAEERAAQKRSEQAARKKEKEVRRIEEKETTRAGLPRLGN